MNSLTWELEGWSSSAQPLCADNVRPALTWTKQAHWRNKSATYIYREYLRGLYSDAHTDNAKGQRFGAVDRPFSII